MPDFIRLPCSLCRIQKHNISMTKLGRLPNSALPKTLSCSSPPGAWDSTFSRFHDCNLTQLGWVFTAPPNAPVQGVRCQLLEKKQPKSPIGHQISTYSFSFQFSTVSSWPPIQSWLPSQYGKQPSRDSAQQNTWRNKALGGLHIHQKAWSFSWCCPYATQPFGSLGGWKIITLDLNLDIGCCKPFHPWVFHLCHLKDLEISNKPIQMNMIKHRKIIHIPIPSNNPVGTPFRLRQ